MSDSTTLKSNKHVFKLFNYGTPKDKKMTFSLGQTIILPVNNYQKEARVSLISKYQATGVLWLKVKSLDKDGEEIASDSIKINTKGWSKKNIFIPVLQAKALRINIQYNGNDNPGQAIWIDKVLIKIDGKDISQQSYYSKKKEDSIAVFNSLTNKYIIPLTSGNDSTMLNNIPGLNQKRIIGLGESTHGSSTIKTARYQFLKNLVLNADCKLVLLETPIDMVLTWDLYIQHKTPNGYQKELEADARCIFGDYVQLVDFLNWLRAYNEHAIRKVHVVGIDNPVGDTNLTLFEYHLALMGKDIGKPYLKMIVEKKYNELIAYSKSDLTLKKYLNSQELEFYFSFIKNEIVLRDASGKIFLNRDSNMAKRLTDGMNIYLEPEEKAAIHAHSAHLAYAYSEIESNEGIKAPLLGLYLRQKYADKYFSISFQIGQGKYIQDECSILGNTILDSLKNPPPYSFEYASLQTGLDYFYIPTKSLGDAIISYLHISRTSRYSNLYQFSPVKSRFDAFVFIRESKAIENIELSPWRYSNNRFDERRYKMRTISKEINIGNFL